MGIIAWIVLGLGAGLLANMLIPGRRSQGLILTCLIGVAGALARRLGSPRKLFHIHTLHGFFNLSTWLTAIVGAAILLLIFHLFTSRGSTSRGRRTRTAAQLRAAVTGLTRFNRKEAAGPRPSWPRRGQQTIAGNAHDCYRSGSAPEGVSDGKNAQAARCSAPGVFRRSETFDFQLMPD